MSCNNDIVKSDRRKVFLLPLLYRVFPITINLNHNSMILSSPCWPEMDRSQQAFKIVYLWDANWQQSLVTVLYHWAVIWEADLTEEKLKRKGRQRLTSLTLCPGVALISHVHSFLLGYLSGQLGLVMMPLGLWIFCSHSAVPTVIASVSLGGCMQR